MRLVLSDRISSGRHEIETQWSLMDMWEAHVGLDMIDDLTILVDRRLKKV